MSRTGYHSAKETYRAFRTGDEWGDSTGFLFAICDTLYEADESIPDEWEYRPSAFGANTEDITFRYIADDLAAGEYTLDDLRDVGRFLHLYTERLRERGLDY